MKSSTVLSILAAVAISLVGVRGDAVSCSVIDYLYYSSDCCDNSNSVQCMESIPQTDKAAIDNLASLKRPDGSACQSGDNIKFTADTGSGSSGIVCADADSCIIPCVNGGTISGTVSGNDCTCNCALGFEGADCGTVKACPACQNGGVVTGSVAGGDCGCDCSATNFIGTECQTPKPITIELHLDGTSFSTDDVLTAQECFDNQAAILTAVLALKNETSITAWSENIGSTFSDFTNTQFVTSATAPKGCYVEYLDATPPDPDEYKLYFNQHATGSDPNDAGSFAFIGINKG